MWKASNRICMNRWKLISVLGSWDKVYGCEAKVYIHKTMVLGFSKNFCYNTARFIGSPFHMFQPEINCTFFSAVPQGINQISMHTFIADTFFWVFFQPISMRFIPAKTLVNQQKSLCLPPKVLGQTPATDTILSPWAHLIVKDNTISLCQFLHKSFASLVN